MGKQDNIYTVALALEDGAADFQTKFENVISNLEDFVVFADLLGGTPCNVASKLLLSGSEFPLYVGMNLPMIINFINLTLGVELDIMNESKDSITYVNDLLLTIDEDDE